MSAVAEMKPEKTFTLGKNEVSIYGKVLGVRSEMTKNKVKIFFTLVRLPSSGEEFESLGTVEVMSSDKFASPGEVVSVRCRLTGYGRRYNKQPDEDGVIKTVQTADVKLRLVE